MSDDERAAKRQGNEEPFRAHWRVENGELINGGEGPYATTDRDYGDIELRVEYRTVARADSGIYLRGNLQVQVWDSYAPTNHSVSGTPSVSCRWATRGPCI